MHLDRVLGENLNVGDAFGAMLLWNTRDELLPKKINFGGEWLQQLFSIRNATQLTCRLVQRQSVTATNVRS
jgi:hypothetical protein